MSESWVPITTAIIAVLGGAIAYWNQKRVDRKTSLLEKRRSVYQRYLELLFDHVEERTEATGRAYDRAKCELLLVASDRVLDTLPMVQEASVMDGNALGAEDVHQRVRDLFVEMRRDCFENSKIEDRSFEYLIPIGNRTPVTPLNKG